MRSSARFSLLVLPFSLLLLLTAVLRAERDGTVVGLSSLVNQQANVPIIGGLLWGVVFVQRRQWWLAGSDHVLPAGWGRLVPHR